MGKLYTIGHSTAKIEFFLSLLFCYGVDCLLDVRSTPYSKFADQFNKEILAAVLDSHNIRYVYMGIHFGARQNNRTLYDNDGILDFEKVRASDIFNVRMKSIEKGLAQGHNIALMCTEKDPFDCHRAIMIARGFELDKINVSHILHDRQLLSQQQLNERLLDHFFPDRNQSVLNFYGDNEKTDQEYLIEAYRKRNKQIGYNLSSGYEGTFDI